MSIPHQILKNRQRTEREGWPEFLSLRVHRALSWLDRAERCEDDDGCFVFCGWHSMRPMPMKPQLRGQYADFHQPSRNQRLRADSLHLCRT